MAGHGIRKSSRDFWFSLGVVAVFSGASSFSWVVPVWLGQVSYCKESLRPRAWIWIDMIMPRGLSI